LGSEVNNGINFVLVENDLSKFIIIDVTLVESILGFILNVNIIWTRAIVHLIQIDEFNISILVGKIVQALEPMKPQPPVIRTDLGS